MAFCSTRSCQKHRAEGSESPGGTGIAEKLFIEVAGRRYNMSIMVLRAIIHADESGGFWAEVPALPGCFTQGETRAEVRSSLREAIEAWFEAGQADVVPEGVEEVVDVAI